MKRLNLDSAFNYPNIDKMISEKTVSFFINLLFGRRREIRIIISNIQQINDFFFQDELRDIQDLSPRIRRANCISLGNIVTLLA